MPFALILIGVILLVAGIRNTYGMTTANGGKGLLGLVEGDFQAGFIPWIVAIGLIGALGYVPKLRPLSIAFMTLLLLVLVISHNGVFAQLQQFVTGGAAAGAGTGSTTLPNNPVVVTPLNSGFDPSNIQIPSSQ